MFPDNRFLRIWTTLGYLVVSHVQNRLENCRILVVALQEASEAIKTITGKDVTNFRVSVYVDRGRRKLIENETLLSTYEGEINLD